MEGKHRGTGRDLEGYFGMLPKGLVRPTIFQESAAQNAGAGGKEEITTQRGNPGEVAGAPVTQTGLLPPLPLPLLPQPLLQPEGSNVHTCHDQHRQPQGDAKEHVGGHRLVVGRGGTVTMLSYVESNTNTWQPRRWQHQQGGDEWTSEEWENWRV